MSDFGKKDIYNSMSNGIETRGGCNCGGQCAAMCACSCSGGLWSTYYTMTVLGSKNYPSENFREPGEFVG
ncbi:MAG: hypothetical protein R3Y58_09155 [Eubacteriales bacterium]